MAVPSPLPRIETGAPISSRSHPTASGPSRCSLGAAVAKRQPAGHRMAERFCTPRTAHPQLPDCTDSLDAVSKREHAGAVSGSDGDFDLDLGQKGSNFTGRRTVAYTSNESGQYEVYVTSFPKAGAAERVSVEGILFGPHWRGDGRELYYVTLGQELMAATVELSGSRAKAWCRTTTVPGPICNRPRRGVRRDKRRPAVSCQHSVRV